MDLQQFKIFAYEWLITSGFKIILIILGAMILNKIIKTFSRKFEKLSIQNELNIEYSKKIQTIHSIGRSVAKYVIMAISVMLILEALGINIGPILAAAGVLGIAVGFGSQRLVEDLISGFIILINDQIRVGDVVQINDKSGYVEKFTLNMIVLRALSGDVHFIRNGKVDIVTNMTKDFSYYVFDIGVAYKENVEEVIKVVKLIDEEIRQNKDLAEDILEPIEILGLDKFDDSAVIIKARIKTKPIKQWSVGREFNLRLKKKFDELGIEIPFPQRTLHIVNAEKNPL